MSSVIEIAVTPDASTVFVANSGDDTVSVIDTQTNTIAETISVATTPTEIAITSEGSTVYVEIKVLVLFLLKYL
jgi:YVTN family beta-propeller protein